MKKVIIRLVIVALAIALVVLILLNTVFKISSTQKAFNSLNDAFSANGTITTMTKELNDLEEFGASYGDYVVVFTCEINNLQKAYPKLCYLFSEEDEKLTTVTETMNQMQASLQEATKIIKDINESKKINPDLNVDTYIQKLKPKIVDALGKVVDLNCNIQEFLTNSYYKGKYFEQPFLDKLKSVIAKEFFEFSSKEYGSPIANELKDFYDYIYAYDPSHETVEESNAMYAMLNAAKDVNLFRLVDNVKAYKKEHSGDTELIAKIEKVENYINNMTVAFNLMDIVDSKEA